MPKLITTRIQFKLLVPQQGINIYCSKSELLFRLKYQRFLEKLKDHSELDSFKDWFGNYDDTDIDNQPFVYYSFQQLTSNDSFGFLLNENYFHSFKKQFIKQILINHFQNKEVLIEFYPLGVDLRILIFTATFNLEWDKYSRYDFIIKQKRNEIVFNRTGENVLISKTPKGDNSYNNIDFNKLRGIVPGSKVIKKVRDIKKRPIRIIGARELKPPISPTILSFDKLYSNLKRFYLENLLDLKNDNLKIQPGGLINVEQKDQGIVFGGSNVMVFKNGQTDINAATGMRKYGHFKESPIANDVQFIFFYENSDDANKLYQYLKNGLKHFPGLQSYVGISSTLADSDLRLKYEKQNLKNSFDQFLSEKLPNDNYRNYFAFFVGPFKKNYQSDDLEEPKLYYHIKKRLLNKGISSQFIFYQSIRSEHFHFYLPNIAIAVLAKLGGIPWKLKEQPYNELIIGFNTKKIDDNQYIGSAVFFDNQGYIKNVNSYQENDLQNIVDDLGRAVQAFRSEIPDERLQRVIIHTYKPYGKKEQKMEELIRGTLRLDIPVIYVEINESKTITEVCFDESCGYGMPMSGTYVKTGWNEYLLFNNTRYIEKPQRYIKEEWPIKLRIYSDPKTTINEKKLISQVYEFSRLYWKGLKQKSQPVTTIYSKLIADYRGNFNEEISDNDISQRTPWFL